MRRDDRINYRPSFYFCVDSTEEFPLTGTPTTIHAYEDTCILTTNRGELRFMNLNKCVTVSRCKISQRGLSNSCLEDTRSYIYSIDYESNLIINSLSDTKNCFELKKLHNGHALAIATPPGMNYLIYTGGTDGLIKLWDLRMLKSGNIPVKTVSNHKSAISSIAFRNPDNSTFCSEKYNFIDLRSQAFPDVYATTSFDGYIRLVNVASDEVLTTYQDLDKIVSHCEFTCNGNYLLSTNLYGKAMRHIMPDPPAGAKLPKNNNIARGIYAWNSQNFPAPRIPLLDKENLQIAHGRILTKVVKFDEYKNKDMELLDLYCSDSLFGLEDNLIERGTIIFRCGSMNGKMCFPLLNGTIQVHDIASMRLLSTLELPRKFLRESNECVFSCVKPYSDFKLILAAATSPEGGLVVYTRYPT